MYTYINVGSDPKYIQFLSVATLKQKLDSCPELVEVEDRIYKHSEGDLWCIVKIINCDENGNYPAGLDQNSNTANLIELTCSYDGSTACRQKHIKLADKIALTLAWQVHCYE